MQAIKSILKAFGANSSTIDGSIENSIVSVGHRRVRIQEDSNEVAYTHSKEDYDRSMIETSNSFHPPYLSDQSTLNNESLLVPGEWADMFLNMGASNYYFSAPIKTST